MYGRERGGGSCCWQRNLRLCVWGGERGESERAWRYLAEVTGGWELAGLLPLVWGCCCTGGLGEGRRWVAEVLLLLLLC